MQSERQEQNLHARSMIHRFSHSSGRLDCFLPPASLFLLPAQIRRRDYWA